LIETIYSDIFRKILFHCRSVKYIFEEVSDIERGQRLSIRRLRRRSITSESVSSQAVFHVIDG